MRTARHNAAAVLLPNGTVAVLGGAVCGRRAGGGVEITSLTEVEVFNPAFNTWHDWLPPLLIARHTFAATVS